MEGNDIGTTIGYKHVVILEPTLIAPPPEVVNVKRRIWGTKVLRARQTAEWLDSWVLNGLMCQWIYMQASRGIGTEVWSFLDEPTFDRLSDRVSQAVGGEIVGWERWTHKNDAMTRLRSDMQITAIYDADPERIATMWGFRGHAVLGGNAP